jgi:DNA-binding LacI/PurR family transcriptional regulator
MSVIERRIRQGDYVLNPIPGERKIAEETGVSHMTARKAVRGLLDRKVLIRRPNGSLDICPGYRADVGSSHLLLLYPAYPSTYLAHLRQTVSEAAEHHGLSLRPVQYVHWDDPVVSSAVSNPAGLILIPISVDVPYHLLPALRSSKCVSLDLDLSDHGVPSIQLFPDAHIAKVFDHLRQLGARRVDCVSTQYHNPEIERRIRLWRQWLRQHEMTGELHERATRSFGDATVAAYDVMREHLQQIEQSSLEGTAFVGTTFPAAVGAMRACWERGLVAGRDVSICAINIEAPAKFMTPSVTGLDTPNLTKLLRQCFDWFTHDHDWKGSNLLEPSRAEFFRGESTGRTVHQAWPKPADSAASKL